MSQLKLFLNRKSLQPMWIHGDCPVIFIVVWSTFLGIYPNLSGLYPPPIAQRRVEYLPAVFGSGLYFLYFQIVVEVLEAEGMPGTTIADI